MVTEVMVRRSDDSLVPFDSARISDMIVRETTALSGLNGVPPCSGEIAAIISKLVESRIMRTGMRECTSTYIRELTGITLVEFGYPQYRNALVRVGMPVADAQEVDEGSGFEHNDNANLQGNAETSHKKKADKMSKEQNLLLLPKHLSEAHLNADIHIHDLEYFGTRPFCQDSDLRYFFYYGLMPDGNGTKASVAGPAQRAEVAVLHAVKALGAAQTNFAGGQGYYNFLTFLAPYCQGMPYKEIKHLMQMFIYEMTQTMIARGGQLVFSSVQLSPGVPRIWRDKPVVYKGRVWDGTEGTTYLDYGMFELEVRLLFQAIMEVMLEGDYWGKPFHFPKPEISVEPDFMTGEYDDLYLKAFELASKFGTPYFDNQLPEYRGAGGEKVTCYQCIPGDTPVLVHSPRGITTLPISEVNEGAELLTSGGTYSPFKAMLKKHYEGDLIVINAEGAPDLKCTPDHQVVVKKDGLPAFVNASEVRKGDHLQIATKYPDCSEDIQQAMTVLNARGNVDAFAQWLGYYCAEGNTLIRPGNVGGHRVQISFNVKEEEYVSNFQRCSQEVFGFTFIHKSIRKESRLLKYGIGFCRALITAGIPAKTGAKGFIPDFMFTAPKSAKMAFLLAFADGEASDSMNRHYKRMTIQVAARKNAEGVSSLLHSLGYTPIVYPLRTRPMWCIALSKQDEVDDFWKGVLREVKPVWRVVRGVSSEEFSGEVYDPVDIEGHAFVLSSGLITGNCCSYQFSKDPKTDAGFADKMYFRDGAHFSMGSWQVVSLNCPRAAYLSGTDDELLARLKGLVDLAIEVFRIKHAWMEKGLVSGRMPFIIQRPKDPVTGKRGAQLVDTEGQVYTIGVVGVNEMVQHMTGHQIHEDPAAYRLAVKVMTMLDMYCKQKSAETGMTIALARTPAETTAQRFAVADMRKFPSSIDLVKGDREYVMAHPEEKDQPVYYTNGTHCYVGADLPVAVRAKYESTFFPIVDGGNIFHIWLGEKRPDPKGLMDMAFRLCRDTNIGYFAFTKDFTVCLSDYTELSGNSG